MTASGEDRRINIYALTIAVVWTIILGGFIAIGVTHAKREIAERSISDAWTHIGKDISFRQWVAKHGGVYVPVTELTPPNPNLSHIPERDIRTPSGSRLTLMNPAYALRQMMSDFEKLYGVKGHLTSLKPIRRQNEPDDWEKRALLQFEKGVKEKTEVISVDGKSYLRAMRPFITEQSCLKCHGAQGYKVGDVRGGISVSVPMEPYFKDEREEIELILLTYGSTWGIVLGAIYLGSQRIRRQVMSRRKAEAEAEYYANRNRMILESAGEGIIGLDSDGTQIFVNPSAAAMLGYRPEELISRKSHAMWHHTRPDGRHYLEEDCPMCRSYQHGEVVRETEVFWRKDGSSFPAEYTVTPIMQGNTIAGAVITFEDITERINALEADRKYMERMLRQQEELLKIMAGLSTINDDFADGSRLITEHVAVALDVDRVSIWLLDNNHAELQCEDLYSKTEGTHSDGFVLKAQAYPAYFEALEKGKIIDANDAQSDPRTREFTDGYLIPLGIVSMMDAAIWVRGSIVGVICHEQVGTMRTWTPDEISFVNSITAQITALLLNAERKRADEALRMSETSLKEAQRIAHIGNWELDLVSNLLTWSDEIYRIFEIDQESFGASYEVFLESIHPDDREFVNKAYNDSLKNRTPYAITHRLLMKDGRVKFVTEQGETTYDADGRPLRSFGTVQDSTEHKKLEEQLRQAQKMEVVGLLAGGIAHDFNNILSAIIGYGSMTQMKMDSTDPLRKNVDQILEAADRAAQLTQSLLAFSRKQALTMRSVDLNEVMQKVEKLLVRLIGEDIAFGICLSKQSLTVMADSGQLEQVLMNLATNARDAMPRGGMLAIRTERITIDREFAARHGWGRPGDYALISVTDTGIGMDAEIQKRIFEPFFTTKEVGKGTGLGLAMVYGIITQHAGFINVYSEPGKGTTFRIYLPLTPSTADGEHKESVAEHPVGGTETILLAEDDEAVRILTKTILEEWGYSVIAAVDGADAVSKYKENRDKISLLLFDLIMPNKTGKDACEEIRLIDPDVKVIFASGYAPDILRGKISLGDEVSIIFKPVAPLELLRKVKSVLDERKANLSQQP